MNIIKKLKTGGRKKYSGNCLKCEISNTSRWYRRDNSAICKGCYDIERRMNPEIRQKRILQRSEWEKTNPYRSAKNTARHKKQPFYLTENEYLHLISLRCFYCNGELNKTGIRLDRKNNNEGYTARNSLPCCRICNVAKNNMSFEDFKTWLNRVYLNLK